MQRGILEGVSVGRKTGEGVCADTVGEPDARSRDL